MSGELSRESYLGRDDLLVRVHEAVGFLDGLAAGLMLYTPQDRARTADSIYAEAERLKRDLPGEGVEPDAG